MASQQVCHRLLRSFLVATVLGVAGDAGGQDAPAVPRIPDGVRVRVGDEVLPLAEVVRRAASDERLAMYRQLRSDHGGTTGGQLELARWCRKRGLEEEETLHWRILHYLQPDHPEAIKALRLQNYEGALLTRDKIAQVKAERKLAQKAEREWKPKLKQIKNSIEHGAAAEREQALRELEAINDPRAMPLVEEIFADGDTQIGLLVVEMFARMARPKSTEGLIRLAVQSPDAAVRKKAASELRYHPLEDFVPRLITGLAAPIELSSYVEVEPGGTTLEPYQGWEYTGRIIPGLYGVIRLRGNYTARDVLMWTLEARSISGMRVTGHRPDRIQYEYKLSRDSPDPDAPYEYTGTIEAGRTSARGSDSLAASNAVLKEKIDAANAETAELNQRIHAALTEAIGAELAPGESTTKAADADVHPRVWWDWWRKKLNLNNYFAQGTEVWTQTGLAPIEEVLVGDRVLTRNLKSDELMFQLVIGFDKKPQQALQVIEVNSRTIVATPEQPFFVIDEGWRRADRLKPGMELHGLAEPQRIEKVKSGLGGSTYSLLIADVPNYFVDRQGILVHDATRQ